MAQNVHEDAKRDKLDIILNILEIGRVPVKKTHILYKAGINFYQLSRYLNLLLRLKMLEEVNNPYYAYRTTERGLQLLKLFSVTELTEKDDGKTTSMYDSSGLVFVKSIQK